jgi:hypothetical protein
LIREQISVGAHEVRHLGNDMAHGDFVTQVNREDAELILTLMSEVLAEVYQSPARVAKAKSARAAKVAVADQLAELSSPQPVPSVDLNAAIMRLYGPKSPTN